MALNKKALVTLRRAWIAIVSFSTYPIVENIVLTKWLVLNHSLQSYFVLASSYYPASELIGLLVSVAFLFPRLRRIISQVKRGELNRNALKCIIEQGILTAIGNILLIFAQKLSTNPVTIVTLGIIPIAYWVIKDVVDGREKGLKISVQFLASILPICVILAEAWPYEVNGELVTIVLLLVRAALIIRIEHLEKTVSTLDGSLVYAIRQLVTFISASIVAMPIVILTNVGPDAEHVIGLCFSNIPILSGIIIVMVLSNVAGEWKIFAKASNSISLVLIMLNAPVLISTVASIVIYLVLFGTLVPISALFITTSAISLGMLVLSLLIERSVPIPT